MVYKVFLHHYGSQTSTFITSFTDLDSALRTMTRMNRSLTIVSQDKPDTNTYYYVLAESVDFEDINNEQDLPFAPYWQGL